MENDETSPTKKSDRMLKVFLANTRYFKGKITELQFLTTDSDIISLNETHLDDTIPNSSILPIEKKNRYFVVIATLVEGELSIKSQMWILVSKGKRWWQ